MTRRPYLLSEMTWDEVKKSNIELAILPWAACEAHNYHLPYGTDIYEANYIAAEAGRKAYMKDQRFVILPTIPFGVNTGQMDIKLDMNIYPSTQRAILADTLEVLQNHGIYKFLLFNSHGGNNFKPILRELGAKHPDMFLSFCNWFQSVDKDKFFEEKGDHADEMETSVMMHLFPDWIDLSKAGDGNAKTSRISGIKEGWAWSERQWSQVSPDTGVGNPHKSTRDKGKRFLEATTDQVSQLILEICALDVKNRYQ